MRPCNVSLRRLLDHEFPHGGAGGGFHLQQVEAAGQAGGLHFCLRGVGAYAEYLLAQCVAEDDVAHLLFAFHMDVLPCRVGPDFERGFLCNLLHWGLGVHIERDVLGGAFHDGIAEPAIFGGMGHTEFELVFPFAQGAYIPDIIN